VVRHVRGVWGVLAMRGYIRGRCAHLLIAQVDGEIGRRHIRLGLPVRGEVPVIGVRRRMGISVEPWHTVGPSVSFAALVGATGETVLLCATAFRLQRDKGMGVGGGQGQGEVSRFARAGLWGI